MVHDLTAVQVGPDRSELLYLSKLGYARLKLVHALRQGGCAGRVARCAVRPGQLVELVEEVTGIPHVAPDGAVGPPHAIGVEAEV